MYKLLIIEDEKWEREGLVDFLDWSELKIEIVGTAVNGVQGLKMAKEFLPEIIITDIKMPLMDGLEFSRIVKCFIPDCKIIIITGYDDFEYAEEAIRYGVYEYLLKPIQKDQLIDVLNKIITSIKNESYRQEHIRILKHQIAESSYENRERFLLNLIDGDLEVQKDLKFADQLIMSFSVLSVVAIVIKFDFSHYYRDKESSERQIHQRELLKLVRKAVCDEGIVTQYNGEDNEIIICLSVKYDSRSYIYDFVRRISQELYDTEIPKFVIGIGSVAKRLSEFADSLEQAKVALEHLFFIKDTDILFCEDIIRKHELQPEFYDFFISAAQHSKRILNGVVSLNSQALSILSEELFEFIYNSHLGKGLVCNYFAGLISELSALILIDDETLNVVRAAPEDALVTLNEFIKLEGLKKFFQGLLLHLNDLVLKQKNNKEEYIVGKVMDIIRKEYECSVGIETIAYRLEVSPNYLGSLFKQHIGKSFTEALTDYRMKKAEEILVSGTKNVIDTAKAVGFLNDAYFCTVFKKTHGISPGNYQKKYSDKWRDYEHDG